MKKSILFFLSMMTAVLLSASDSQATYSTLSQCQANCTSPWSCRIPNGGTAYVCNVLETYYCVSSGVKATIVFKTLADCKKVTSTYNNVFSSEIVRECYKDQNGWYRFHVKDSSCSRAEPYKGPEPEFICPANCSSCDSSSVCTTCESGYYLSSGSCASCPSNATCDGSSTFTCNSGYKKSGNSCVKDKTVSSCPSRMTLSSDGCCCINK